MSSINQRIREEQRAQIEQEEKGLADMVMGIQQGVSAIYQSPVNAYYNRKDYLREAKGWIYACVNVIADEMASTEFMLKKFTGGDVSEIDEHPILDLLYRANNVTTKYDLIKLTFQYLELTGEAPWFLSYKGGKPESIIILRPDRLTIKPGKDGELIGGYKYRTYSATGGMQDIDLEPFEVVPIRYTDPDNPLRGKGPLFAASEVIDLDEKSERWNKQFFMNAASPSAVLQSEGKISKETRTKLERQVQEKYTGYENAHKTIILEGGIKWAPISLSQKEMDFIEQQRFSRDKILAIFRVPRTVLGITDDVNRANAEATDYVFARRTIKPKLEGFIQQLNEFLVPLFDDSGSIYLDYEDPVPENVDLQLREAQTGVQAGFMTINEARELLDLDPVPDGDTLRDPLNFAPVLGLMGKELTGGAKKKEQPTRNQKFSLLAQTKIKREVALFKKTIAEHVQKSVQPIIESMLRKADKRKREKELKKKLVLAKAVWSGNPEDNLKKKLEFQVEQHRIGDQFEPRFKQELNKIFAMQKIEALRKIEEGKTGNDVLDDGKQVDRYVERLDPIIYNIIRRTSRAAFKLVGQDNELVREPEKALTRNQAVILYLRNHVFKLANQLTDHTNELLGKALSEGVQAQEGIPDLKKRVGDLFVGMESYRSERIARTEITAATSMATEEAYIVSEVVEAKEWLPFSPEDEECDIGGETAPLGGTFSNGYDSPPVHPNCRCSLIPVIS